VLAGQGIAAFTRLTVQEDLLHGRLVRVLPQHHAGRRHYYAVYPHARQLAPKVRARAGFMARHYAALQQVRPVIPEA
ncbi:MAG: LysR substrate-binding domain-containing protein, partial [Stenotrophomonas maltophilia]